MFPDPEQDQKMPNGKYHSGEYISVTLRIDDISVLVTSDVARAGFRSISKVLFLLFSGRRSLLCKKKYQSLPLIPMPGRIVLERMRSTFTAQCRSGML